ncbi:hypothetical protein ACFWDP_40225, partial [Streptomyces anthocyanicus]
CTHGQGVAFSGPLDEYRMRRALAGGAYTVPHGPVEPVFAGGGGSGVFAGGGASAYAAGAASGGYGTGIALRSHNETPVPPT